MRTNILLIAFASAVLTAGSFPQSQIDPLHPQYLRCENLIDPSGIDIATPRLSCTLSRFNEIKNKLRTKS